MTLICLPFFVALVASWLATGLSSRKLFLIIFKEEMVKYFVFWRGWGMVWFGVLAVFHIVFFNPSFLL